MRQKKIPVPGGIRTLVGCNFVPGVPRIFKRRDLGYEVGSDAVTTTLLGDWWRPCTRINILHASYELLWSAILNAMW